MIRKIFGGSDQLNGVYIAKIGGVGYIFFTLGNKLSTMCLCCAWRYHERIHQGIEKYLKSTRNIVFYGSAIDGGKEDQTSGITLFTQRCGLSKKERKQARKAKTLLESIFEKKVLPLIDQKPHDGFPESF